MTNQELLLEFFERQGYHHPTVTNPTQKEIFKGIFNMYKNLTTEGYFPRYHLIIRFNYPGYEIEGFDIHHDIRRHRSIFNSKTIQELNYTERKRILLAAEIDPMLDNCKRPLILSLNNLLLFDKAQFVHLNSAYGSARERFDRVGKQHIRRHGKYVRDNYSWRQEDENKAVTPNRG